MARVFGLATRAFWTGARWKGPTGTEHVVLNIGSFKRPSVGQGDGASKYYPAVVKSFELQLVNLSGLAFPPPNTGIVPIPFTGYI